MVPEENCTDLEYDIGRRILRDVGTIEGLIKGTKRRGNNRNPRIDRYTERSGLTPPQYWCAIWAGCVIADCGGLVPEGFPDCDRWAPFLVDKPRPMCCVLYGKPGKLEHIGFWLRYEREDNLVLTGEGNRGFGQKVSNNGIGVSIAPIGRDDIMGFYHQRPASGDESERQDMVRQLEEVHAYG